MISIASALIVVVVGVPLAFFCIWLAMMIAYAIARCFIYVIAMPVLILQAIENAIVRRHNAKRDKVMRP